MADLEEQLSDEEKTKSVLNEDFESRGPGKLANFLK
uniref:Capping actin protein of muscle Z-line subunit alpha 2 n=1 Tax=Piliocolobus tephrosceles TaxID=591936 RepID=A0A8C9LRR0_9PRIM